MVSWPSCSGSASMVEGQHSLKQTQQQQQQQPTSLTGTLPNKKQSSFLANQWVSTQFCCFILQDDLLNLYPSSSCFDLGCHCSSLSDPPHYTTLCQNYSLWQLKLFNRFLSSNFPLSCEKNMKIHLSEKEKDNQLKFTYKGNNAFFTFFIFTSLINSHIII